MAYKFQLGAAILSGSLTQEGQVLAKDSALSGSSLSIAGTAVTATAAELNLLDNITRGSILVGGSGGSAELDAKTSGQILVGDGTDVASVAVSGDATLAANGALTIADGAVEGVMLNSNAAGNGLTYTADTLAALANPTNATITVASAGLSVRSAGSLEATPTGLAVKVSGSDPAAAGLIVDNGGIKMNSSISGDRTFEDNITIQGNLTVSGTTVEVDAAFVVTSSIQFEGSTPDGNEISLTSADPTADRTITLPDLSGHVPLLAGAISNANVTAAEFALLDGGSTVQTATVEDGDAVLFNDGTTMKHMNVTSLKTYFQTGVSATSTNGFAFNQFGTGSAAQSLNGTAGFWGVNAEDGSSSNALTLDLSGSWTNGNVVIIKAPNNAATNNVTVRASGSGGDADTIDGESSILLESNNAAVTLVYGGGNWNIV